MPKVLSAGVVPLRRTQGGWRMLVLRAYKNWDFPKGRVEPGEEPIDAARRETTEETGSPISISLRRGAIAKRCLTPNGKVARYYLAETRARKRAPADLPRARPARASRVALGDLRRGRRPAAAAPRAILDWARETIEDGE